MAKVSKDDRENTRKRLLESAAKHFAKSGYEATNINEVATDAGFAQGTIYNYFKSKEELFGEVLTEAARGAVERYASISHEGAVRDSLKALVKADIEILKEKEDFMKVIIGEAMSHSSDKYDVILEHLSPFVEKITEILSFGLENKEIREDKPISQLSLFFLGTLILLYIEFWRSNKTWPTLEEIPDLAVTMFLDGAGSKE